MPDARFCLQLVVLGPKQVVSSLPLLLILALLAGDRGVAQELKVDINNTGRWWYNSTETGYTPWNTNYAWFPGGDTTTGTFNGVTVTFTRIGANGGALKPSYWKDGAETWGFKLIGDGLKVDNGDVGPAQIEMRLAGLTPGSHTLLTYHNDWDNHVPADVAPLNIFVDGVQQVTNLPHTVRTNSPVYATAYLSLEAVAGQDVVVLFAVNTNTPATKENVWINGFEIDTPNSTLKASKPAPANVDEHVDADSKSLWLRWTAAGTALSHDVYFGTDSNAVKFATHASPPFKGNQMVTNYLATDLSSRLTYYWRIDEVHPGAVVTPGDVWMFRPRRLAFPGAEGYGRFAIGGRGGVVRKVTNLNNSGPGSFRDAIEGNYGPRTVLFDVSGLITLESDVIIGGSRPYITVAGQTAPGKGICFRKQQFALSGPRDAIVRHVRVRVGDLSGETQNGSGMSGADHTIMDHVSISWGIDEELSTRTAKNCTFQRSLISEALNIAGHQNYPPGTRHGYAATVGGDIASLHHNLLAHCEGRNWSLGGGLDGSGYYAGKLDIFNNVVYNWRSRTTDGGAHQVNFVNNYYKAGAASSQEYALNAQYGGFPGTQQYYFEGNVMTPGGGVSPGFGTNNQASGKTTSTENGGTLPENSNPPYSAWVSTPFFPSYAVIDEVTNAYKRVLSDVGCNQPMMDDHDSRVIRETIDGSYTYSGSVSGSPGLPDSQNDVDGWEDYGDHTRPVGWDTDNDGLPNWWEVLKGLNSHSPANDFSDSNGDPDGDEYTNLEDYLNWMAVPHAECNAGSFVEVDLTALTRGFTNNSPVYAVFGATNGTISLVGGGKVARSTPIVSTNALGSFDFSVVDAQGYTMTNRVGLHIIAAGAPAQPPILGIRNQNGQLQIELTGETGRPLTVQTNGSLAGVWLDWTNVTGSGAMQLLPLNSLTNQSPRYFRAFAQ
jgi:hypothetical protein